MLHDGFIRHAHVYAFWQEIMVVKSAYRVLPERTDGDQIAERLFSSVKAEEIPSSSFEPLLN